MRTALSQFGVSLSRRDWMRTATAVVMAPLAHLGVHSVAADEWTDAEDQLVDRTLGLLLGAAIGDALGGPVEFQAYEDVRGQLPDCRSWPATRKLTDQEIQQLADSLRLLPYAPHRPEPEPYGQWATNAPPGTVTDDTRMKMITMHALDQRPGGGSNALSVKDMASAFLATNNIPEFERASYADLRDEGFREFAKAARWVLGQREAGTSAPTMRIWGGLPTCCGQMILPPLAALYPGQPERAYRAAYAVSFFDQGTAKDTNAAIVAGLSAALAQAEPTQDNTYSVIRQAIVATDPYGYADVPFITRPVLRWLELAELCVEQAEGRPAELYQRLKSAFHPHYYWESRYTFGAAWALLSLCKGNCLAAMHLALDLGHDTDSVAQLIGALGGAIHGAKLFPERLAKPVVQRLAVDYGVSLSDWSAKLARWRASA